MTQRKLRKRLATHDSLGFTVIFLFAISPIGARLLIVNGKTTPDQTSAGAISIHHGCYRDVECGKGEYCDTKAKGCSPIPECEVWQARKDGDDYGPCVSCLYDQECNWTVGFGRPNDHSYCWRGDGICRQKPPFVMGTYSWSREYDAQRGFIDNLSPMKRFSQGQVMCFVVATPFPPEYARYLRVSLDRVQLCALRQTEYEALLRMEESKRVEKHHGVGGVHKHHGIIPYDPEDHPNTGCRTASGDRLNHRVLESPVQIGDEHPQNTTFEIMDSETGASALCMAATAICPETIPVYIEATVSIEPQTAAIQTLLSSEDNDKASHVSDLLKSYGISLPSLGNGGARIARSATFPPPGPSQPSARHATLVVSNLDDEAYVLCPHGSHFDGHHGHCMSSHFNGEFYLWLSVLSGASFTIGIVFFLLSFPSQGGVVAV